MTTSCRKPGSGPWERYVDGHDDAHFATSAIKMKLRCLLESRSVRYTCFACCPQVHLSRLIASIEASLHSSSRVNMFGALVGHPSCKDWPKSSETVFISVLSQIFSKAGGVPNTEATEGRSDIERTVLQDAAAAALPAMPWNNIEQKLIAAGGGRLRMRICFRNDDEYPLESSLLCC